MPKKLQYFVPKAKQLNILIKFLIVMRNYRGDSYQRLRSLYEQKFFRDGWQSFHQPVANAIKFKNNNLSSNQITQRDNSSHHKTLVNDFGKYEDTLTDHKKPFSIKDKSKTPKSQIIIVCQYTEQTPKSLWMKDPQKIYLNQRRNAFTSEIKQRKWVTDNNWSVYKNKHGRKIQLKQKDGDSRVSKKSTIIKILQQLKSEQKGKKKQKYQISLQSHNSREYKSNVIHCKQQKVLSLLRKNELKQYHHKSKTNRESKPQRGQLLQYQAKIDGWNVTQHEY